MGVVIGERELHNQAVGYVTDNYQSLGTFDWFSALSIDFPAVFIDIYFVSHVDYTFRKVIAIEEVVTSLA